MEDRQSIRGILVLEDGRTFAGRAFGACEQPTPITGEVVFNTSLTGYQEILTDPSYAGQIVTLTTPQIGNTGVNRLDAEASRAYARGLLVRDLSLSVSNWRSEGSLPEYLKKQGIFGLSGVDTRALTRHIRSQGALRGILAAGAWVDDGPGLLERVRQSPSMAGAELVQDVTCSTPYVWQDASPWEWLGAVGAERQTVLDLAEDRARVGAARTLPLYHAVAIDCGIKHSILRQLVDHGFRVTVVPASWSAEAILELKPDGIFVSNGPGDPAAVQKTIVTLQKLVGKLPLFGICLGHQLLALALGGSTYKLKFGHRGGNHPVQDLRTGKVAITAQNHGFAVDMSSLSADVVQTHVNLNDHTCEGLEHAGLRAFSIQYHPEAGPGPHDALEHFTRFRKLIELSH